MSLTPEQLHVIRVYPRLPPLPGGMERHIAALTAAQRALGVRVTEIYNRGEPAGESIQLWPGRRLYALRPAALRDLLFYGEAARRHTGIAPGGVRVVHAHGDWSAFMLARPLAKAFGARATAASLHATIPDHRHLYRYALRGCAPIFSTGLAQARLLSEWSGQAVMHLPSAPADQFFELPRSTTHTADVIAVGNLYPVKSVAKVLACAARRPNLSFAIYGDGPQRSLLEAQCAREGLNNVRLHGAVSPEKVHAAMSAARLFISTSATEGSPTAALEAMACRLPVLLTPSNDYSAIVEPGVNGLVTSGWEVDELVRGIDTLLSDPERTRAAGEASRAIAERHRWAAKARLVTDAMIAAAAGRR